MTSPDFSMNQHLELSEDVFRMLRDAIYQRSGMFFSDNSKYLLQRRLSPRARELNFQSFQKYLYFLQYDPQAEREFDRIFDVVTTNETYFFREPAQLSAFADEIVPSLLEKNPGRKIRIWSAGCSSGEEPFTIAMLLEERGMFELAPFEIFASDINQAVLAKARKGIYRESAFRVTAPALRDRYFTKEESGQWRIADSVRNRVSFGRLNLYDPPRVSLLGNLDVVFCRNVIIYFDDHSKRVVISNFYQRLISDGYLLLGHSESLISLSTQFKLRHLKNDMVYQK